jgi:hypothetical protein
VSRSIQTALFVALAVLATSACAPGRLADLQDSGRISVGLSLGLSADAKLGDVTHPAIGLLSSSAMVGFETRHIDGVWYEARVSDPFATYWYRRAGQGWAWSLNSSGWRGMWEALGYADALDEIDETFDAEPLPETGTVYQGETLDGEIVASRWLPIPWGAPDDASALFRFNTATDLQFGATLGIVGGRVGFNPLEFVDFVLGFAGFDIAGDDPPPTP